jgi:hypothetical protein
MKEIAPHACCESNGCFSAPAAFRFDRDSRAAATPIAAATPSTAVAAAILVWDKPKRNRHVVVASFGCDFFKPTNETSSTSVACFVPVCVSTPSTAPGFAFSVCALDFV